ncbi:argininosuccinate lyase [Sediminibacterium sp.]|uniref:argininosuccinate lyase n=1 Tax=Sediminibacterium sp. TaxID=1917865 RepID=UPI002732E2F8|nr:argininosuccinate lyase [Sediminibacterium sp.]MDP3567371.1 argininosuccinate lyase [Sediminibacterium sp.]
MKTKLWEKESVVTPHWLLEFTAGNDKILDLELAEFDVLGSMAHIEMLAKVGLIGLDEYPLLKNELLVILSKIKNNEFVIEEGVEDVHSQVEILLTRKLGDVGKKIHTARSRNDQVLTDIKLYTVNELKKTVFLINDLFKLLISKSEEYKNVLIPGYTHLQAAMPSSFGLWFGAYAESLCDDMEMVNAAYNIANKNPLGSGAGYGGSLPIDRDVTTELLNFDGMNYNVVYAQMTRGKTEKATTIALATVAATLSKLAMDICLYNSQNFGFVSFPDSLTTGSSIMPHKKNPDVFELVRAKCNRLQALPNELTLLLNNLPSGYHRDFQLTKEILFPAFKEMHACIKATIKMLEQIQINKNAINDEKYKFIFSVEAVNQLVLGGMSFRDAYQKVGAEITNNEFEFNETLKHTHQGCIHNLCNDEITKRFEKLREKF